MWHDTNHNFGLTFANFYDLLVILGWGWGGGGGGGGGMRKKKVFHRWGGELDVPQRIDNDVLLKNIGYNANVYRT